MNKLQILQKNLRYLRREHGYSQEFIGQICGGKHYTTVQKWETGDTEPTLSTVLLLCELYNVNIDDMINVDLRQESL